MLDHPTLDQLKALRLVAPKVRVPRNGMAAAFAELQAQDAAGDLTHAEAGLLIDSEVARRNTRRSYVASSPSSSTTCRLHRARRRLDPGSFPSANRTRDNILCLLAGPRNSPASARFSDLTS